MIAEAEHTWNHICSPKTISGFHTEAQFSNDKWTRTRTVELIRNETSLRAPVQSSPVQSSPSPVQSNGLDRLWHISDDQSNQNSGRGAPRAFLPLSFFCTPPSFADPFNAAFYCLDCTSFCSDFLPVRSFWPIVLLFYYSPTFVAGWSTIMKMPRNHNARRS